MNLENHKRQLGNKQNCMFLSCFFSIFCEIGGLSDQVAGIPLFIGMFYFKIEFVVWEGYIIIIFNKCLLSRQSIPVVGTGSAEKLASSAHNDFFIFRKAGYV